LRFPFCIHVANCPNNSGNRASVPKAPRFQESPNGPDLRPD
jgi:hypothetical protein